MKEIIKAFVTTTVSKPDIYGNTSALCTVTNARTAKSVTFQTDGNNGAHMVCKILGGWSGVHHQEHLKTPIREFNKMAKGKSFDWQVDLYKLLGKRKPKEGTRAVRLRVGQFNGQGRKGGQGWKLSR